MERKSEGAKRLRGCSYEQLNYSTIKPAAKSLIKWLLIAIAGIALYYLAAGAAFAERGYKDYGGECVFLLLPLWWKLGEVVTTDIKQTIKQMKTEVTENE